MDRPIRLIQGNFFLLSAGMGRAWIGMATNCFYRVTVIITKGDTEAWRKTARGSACSLEISSMDHHNGYRPPPFIDPWILVPI